MTKGRGPDRCIDAVGAEAHAGGSVDAVVDKVKAAMFLGTDRPHVLREAIMSCRKGGTLSVPGVYVGFLDKVPFGALMNRASRSGPDRPIPTATSPPFSTKFSGRDRSDLRHHASCDARGRPGSL